jgi:hypothetical protein
MKPSIFLLSLFIPTISFSEDMNEQINKACSRHAVSLVASLKSEVVGDLSQEKSAQALKLATDSCQAYLKKEFGGSTATVATVEEAQEKEVVEEDNMDWFTTKILSGDTTRKEGNKRLKRLK